MRPGELHRHVHGAHMSLRGLRVKLSSLVTLQSSIIHVSSIIETDVMSFSTYRALIKSI
jgi:hypothetical protein